MAQGARDPELAGRIDDYLRYVRRAWAGVPEVVAEWAEWDSDSRLTFRLNWSVPADRLAQLRQWVTQGLLTPLQLKRYHAIEQLVAKHRPLVERLLQEQEPRSDSNAAIRWRPD